MFCFDRFSDKLVFVLITLSASAALLAPTPAHAIETVPSTVGEDFQATVVIQHPDRSSRVGDFFHVIDSHGEQIGLIRVIKFDSTGCVARIVEGEALFGSSLVKDAQMTADRNRRLHARYIASADSNADKVGAERVDASNSQISSVDGEQTGWRVWTPIQGWPMRKMAYIGLSPSTASISGSSSASPQMTYGFTLGATVEFMKTVSGFETGLSIYQTGFKLANSSATATYAFDYLGIPLLYKHTVFSRENYEVRLKGGLMESFLLSKEQTYSGSSTTSAVKWATTDTLLTLGTDVIFPATNPESFSYWAQATFSYGLLNMNQGTFTSAVNNEVFNVSGGIYF